MRNTCVYVWNGVVGFWGDNPNKIAKPKKRRTWWSVWWGEVVDFLIRKHYLDGYPQPTPLRGETGDPSGWASHLAVTLYLVAPVVSRSSSKKCKWLNLIHLGKSCNPPLLLDWNLFRWFFVSLEQKNMCTCKPQKVCFAILQEQSVVFTPTNSLVSNLKSQAWYPFHNSQSPTLKVFCCAPFTDFLRDDASGRCGVMSEWFGELSQVGTTSVVLSIVLWLCFCQRRWQSSFVVCFGRLVFLPDVVVHWTSTCQHLKQCTWRTGTDDEGRTA